MGEVPCSGGGAGGDGAGEEPAISRQVDMEGFNNAVSEGETGQAAKAWKAPKPEGQRSNELLGQ